MEIQPFTYGDVTPAHHDDRFADSEKTQKFQIITWTEYLKVALNFTKNYQLQKHFSGDNKFKYDKEKQTTTQPTDWYKQASGESCPSDKKKERAAIEVPSSKYIYDMALWTLITEPVTKDWIYEQLLKSRPDIFERLFKRTGELGGKLERKDVRDNDYFHNFLIKSGSIEALNTILLLMAEDEFKFSPITFISRRVCLIKTMINVCFFSPFDDPKLIHFLFESILKRFFIPLNFDLSPEFDIKTNESYSSKDIVNWVSIRITVFDYLTRKKLIPNNVDRVTALEILNKYHFISDNERFDICKVIDNYLLYGKKHVKESKIKLILPNKLLK